MKSPYVNDLKADQIVHGTFLVAHKDIRQKKSGDPYLSLILGDRTGELDAKMWDNAAEVMDTFKRDDFVRVKGQLQIFQNRPQLTLHKIQLVPDAEVDSSDFFPASPRDREEMFRELQGWIGQIVNPHLKGLLETIFSDPPVAASYRTAPAAKTVHHAWIGGLIEHVLSLCHLARFTATHYADIDFDLLLSGVILHDLGKIHELSYSRAFGYTTQGQLLGHIIIGMRIVDEKLRQMPDFPPKLRDLLLHLILSHHGELEYGSPKVPLFPEALLLHHLDNLDSKMEAMRAQIDKDRLVEGVWTGYNSALGRSALKKRKFLEPVEPAAAATPAASGGAASPTASPVHGAVPATAPASAAVPSAKSEFASKLRNAIKDAG